MAAHPGGGTGNTRGGAAPDSAAQVASAGQHEPSWLRIYLAPVLVVLAILAAAVWLLDLVPPKRLSFAAGRPGGAYHDMALQYRAILARDGIDMRIVDTAGSVENAAALSRKNDPADAGFLQGGVGVAEDAPVNALAATFLEPLWIFHNGALADPANPVQWENLRIAAGETGSGTRFVVDSVLDALEIEQIGFEIQPIGGAEAGDALLEGSIDVAFFVAPVTAPYLQRLFDARSVTPAEIRDGEALARRLPFVQLTDIPRSGLDYADREPPRRIELIAMVGRLAARTDLHPSLVDRLANAARAVHSGRDLITDEDQFPTTIGAAMPVNVQSASIISSGPNPLYRFLPYWMVAQVNSYALLLVPILFLVVPLIRAIPGIYQWRMRARVYRHYLDLLEVDRSTMAETDPEMRARLRRRLDAIEADLVEIRLPLRFRENAYAMRLHIDLVRNKLAENGAPRAQV